MFHIINHNTVYDLINEDKIEINLVKGKETIDISKFLDDISIWMDTHRNLIGEQYLPFSFLSVGTLPVQISSFMFGLFVGKALEKHGLKIKLDKTHILKEEILKDLEDNMGKHKWSSDEKKEK
jgi:hypothetical protein